MTIIEYGDPIEIRDVHGEWLPAVARGSVEPTHRDGQKIHDFPVLLVELAGWDTVVPWPASDVRPYVYNEGSEGTR